MRRLEQFATGIVVLAALQTLPPAPCPRRTQHPPGAPCGFARVQARDRAMRAMQRRLFPREPDLKRRLARFDAILDAVAGHAARLVRHIERLPPTSRLIATAPPADPLAARAGPTARAFDTS